MTAAQDQIRDFADRGQQALRDAAQLWADNLRDYTTELTTPSATLASSFDLAEKLFAAQRAFAAEVFAANTGLVEATCTATERAASATLAAVRRATLDTDAAIRDASRVGTAG